MSTRVLVMTPAFNEEKSIGGVLERIHSVMRGLEYVDYELLVIDDGSSDDTSRVAERCGARVIRHVRNLGPGTATQTGFKYASRNDFEYVVRLDSDGQHPPESIPEVLGPVMKGEADVVIGSRYLSESDYDTSVTRGAGITFFSKLTSLIIHQRITDVTSGFRALNIDVVDHMKDSFPKGIIALEVTIREGLNFTIEEVPVEMEERRYGTSYLSLQRMMKYPLYSMYVMLKALMRDGG